MHNTFSLNLIPYGVSELNVWMIFEYELNDFHKYVYFPLLWSDGEKYYEFPWYEMHFNVSIVGLQIPSSALWMHSLKEARVCVWLYTLCVLNTLMWAFYTLAIKLRRIWNWILIDSLESSFHKRLVVLVIVRCGRVSIDPSIG